MKVLIAIDSFKGSLSSLDAGLAIKEGIQDVFQDAEIVTLPLADGGEGTVEAIVHAKQGEIMEKEVTGPLGEKIQATYGRIGKDSAVIEVASACGLPLVSDEKKNPAFTTTFGVGELILDGIDKGCREFTIGLGGSSTNDAGLGMLQALGFSFLDERNKEVGLGGIELHKIRTIDVSRVNPRLKECTFKVACDVHNPLYGENGASSVFGPQKGATPEMVMELDAGLKHFAELTYDQLNRDIQRIPGAGAAGGLGAAFAGFLNGKLLSGAELLLETMDVETQLENTDFVITGEGRLDGQTSMGKTPLGVAKMAAKHNIPVIALAGGVTRQASVLNDLGITSYFSIINEPMTLDRAMETEITFTNLRLAAEQIFRLIYAIKQ